MTTRRADGASPAGRVERAGAGPHVLLRLLWRLPRTLSWVLAAGWLVLIFFLSEMPAEAGPGAVPTSWLLNGGHAFLYGLLALWILLGLPRSGDRPRLVLRVVGGLLALTLLLGALDEFHQSLVPGRDFSLCDLLTDVVGAASVLWIIAYLARADFAAAGLWVRVLGGFLACVAAAGIATFLPGAFPDLNWL